MIPFDFNQNIDIFNYYSTRMAGKLHSFDNKPSTIDNYISWLSMQFHCLGLRHRNLKPAVIHFDIRDKKINCAYHKSWYQNNKRHRLNAPAYIDYSISGKINHISYYNYGVKKYV